MRVVVVIFAILLIPSVLEADYTITIDPDLDYYEESEESGVTPIPQPYQASPTVTTLRDLLIIVGIMSAVPSVATDDGVFQNRDKGVFQGRKNAVFQDRFN